MTALVVITGSSGHKTKPPLPINTDNGAAVSFSPPDVLGIVAQW